METNLDWTSEHPVSRVCWILSDHVNANDYNPNSVAAPEMDLLEHSIRSDGFTQPIVVWRVSDDWFEVIDVPCVIVNNGRTERSDRIASTIRHNRARGKHQVGAMSEIVQELARRNWSDRRIGKELGMEPDEVLRLKQITGLADLFRDQAFSEAWDVEGGRS